MGGEYFLGRSDLLLDSGETETFGVRLPPPVVPYIPTKQSPCLTPDSGTPVCHNHILAIADTEPTFGCNGNADMPGAEARLGLPDCQGPIDGFRVVSTGDFLIFSAK